MITLDTLRNVSARRSLVLNNTSDQLIQNKAFQRLRSFFNIGNARAENAQTLAAIRTAILNDPRFAACAEDSTRKLDSLLGAVRTDRAISSTQIRSIISQMDAFADEPRYRRRAIELRIDARLAAVPRPPVLQRLTDSQYANIARETIYNGSGTTPFNEVDVPGAIDQLNTQLAALIEGLQGEPEILDILFTNYRRAFPELPHTGLVEGLAQRIEGFRAALAAVPQGPTPEATAANRRVCAELLCSIGKPIDPRHITLMSAFAATLPIDRFATLPPNASAEAICRATIAFLDALGQPIPNFPEDLQPLEGGDELWPARKFLCAMAVGRLPREQRDAVVDALTSANASKACAFFVSLDGNERLQGHGLAMGLLAMGVASYDDRPVPPYGNPPLDYREFSPAFLTETSPLDGCFTGNCAKLFKKFLTAIPGTIDHPQTTNISRSQNPGADFKAAVAPTIKSMVALTAASEMKKALDGETTIFEKDINRDMRVRLPDGTLLPNNHAEALDRLTAVLSGNPAERFETAPAALRNRVLLVTSLLSQETEKIVDDGLPAALNGKDPSSPFGLAFGAGERIFALALNPDGGLTITYDRNLPVNVVVGLDNRDLFTQPGSFQAAHLSITLTGADMDHFLAANWPETDLSAVVDRMAHPRGPGDLGNVFYAVPDSCRLNPQVEVGYHLHLDRAQA